MKQSIFISLFAISFLFACQKEPQTSSNLQSLASEQASGNNSAPLYPVTNMNVNWKKYIFSIDGNCENIEDLVFKSFETREPIELYGNPQGLQIRARALIYLYDNGEFSLTYREYKYSNGDETQDFEKIIRGLWSVHENKILLGQIAVGEEIITDKDQSYLSVKFLKNISDPRLIEIPEVQFIFQSVSEGPAKLDAHSYCLGIR